MASSGSLLTSGWYFPSKAAYVYLELTWRVTATSIENNTKTIYWQLGRAGASSGYVMSGGFKVVIDGETVYSKDTDYRIKLEKDTIIATGTKTIKHNADGSRSFKAFVQGAVNTFAVNVSGEKTFELDTIPRASSISCTTANIESKPTITINRASSNFTHTITYQFGTLTGTIATKTAATSITSWTIPADFYKQIPNAKTGRGTLTCTTYNGNTVIGTSACQLNVTTDEAKCKPTVTGSVVDRNPATKLLTGDENILVRYCSKAGCTIGVTLNKNAGSIKAKTINNVSVTGDYRQIDGVEVGVFDFYAKDSREYFNSYKAINTLIPYVKLTCNATAQRTDPTSGNATLTVDGAYYNGSFGLADNSLTVKYRLVDSEEYTTVTPTITGNGYKATVSLSGLDYTKSFTFEVVVSDKLNSVTKTVTIQKGIPVFDWGEYDFNFNVPVTINGIPIRTPEQGTNGVWTYRKWDDGICELWCQDVATIHNAAVMATEERAYPFSLERTICGIGTLNSAGGNAGNALQWNIKLAYGTERCQVWVHDNGSNFADTSSVDVSIYIVGRWK